MDSDKVAAEKVKRGQRVKVKRLTAWVHFFPEGGGEWWEQGTPTSGT